MNFQEYDNLLAQRAVVKRKIEAAQTLIRSCDLTNRNVSLSFSGGKDSTAALLLLLSVGVQPVVVWFNSGYEYPETESYIVRLCKKNNLELRVIKPHTDPLQAKISVGFFDLEAVQKKNKEILSAWHSTNKEYDVVVTGMRVQESRARRMAISKNGVYFFNKTYGAFALYPVAFFSAQEVFATIAVFNETPHPLYAKAKTIDERDWLRVNWYILTAAERGYYVFLKREYREQFERLAIHLPEIRKYV